MVSVSFYNLAKRNNSTAQPTGTGTNFSCALKDGTSETNPVFLLSTDSFNFSYAKWDNRFYFVTSVEYTRNGLFSVACRIDVLATFKTAIGTHSAYVAYSASQHSASLRDSRIPVDVTTGYSTNTADFLTAYQSDTGTYVLTCVGESGSVDSWALDASQLESLFGSIQEYQTGFDYENPDEPGGENVWEWLKYSANCFSAFGEWTNKATKDYLAFGDASSCIRSCFWVPYAITSLSSDDITLGAYHTGVRARKVRFTTQQATDSITIPWHFSDWRNTAPNTDLVLYIPYVGTVPLPVSQLYGKTTITVKSCLSTLSGDLAVEVLCGGVVIGTYGANVAVSVPIGVSNVSNQTSLNSLFGVTGGAAALVGGAASGNFALAAGGAAALAGSVSNAVTPVTGSVGGIGNAAGSGLDQQLRLSCIYHDTATAPADTAVNALRGRPLFASRTINTLTGYVQTLGFSFSGDCHDDERAEINRLMDAGVYLE